jgi:hypothetical protein
MSGGVPDVLVMWTAWTIRRNIWMSPVFRALQNRVDIVVVPQFVRIGVIVGGFGEESDGMATDTTATRCSPGVWSVR